MNNFKVGSLVLLSVSDNICRDKTVPNGAIGEILSSVGYQDFVGPNDLCVNFPNYPAPATLGWWVTPKEWVKPLGGDDVLSDEDKEDSPYALKKPEESLT